MFDLPMKTPTPGIIFTLGVSYTRFRITQKQLIYLQRVLQRDSSHWTRKVLNVLGDLNLGWYKHIKQVLTEFSLTDNFEQIRNTRTNDWRNKVKEATEKKHKERLLEDCHKMQNGQSIIKTKTAHIVCTLKGATYKREPQKEVLQLSKKEIKILIVARYHMLECGRNFHGTLSEICNTCSVTDDEEHRLNICPNYSHLNFRDQPNYVPFETIYSCDTTQIRTIIERISQVWNVQTGHGAMN